MNLNIGAGKTRIQNFINIDISKKADVVLDLNKDPLPFETDSADIVFSAHTLEHVSNYLFALGEIYRVLKPWGKLYLALPYITLTEMHLVNPYHKTGFNEFSFDFFNPDLLKGSAAEENPILFKKIFHRYHYMGKIKHLPAVVKNIARRHLFNIVKEIDFGLYCFKPACNAQCENPMSAAAALVEFDQISNSRTPH